MVQDSRVLIVDDHPTLREGLRAWLVEQDWVADVIEAATVQEALREATHHQVNVVVMDVALPDGDGIEAVAKLVQRLRDVKVLVLTYNGDDEQVHRALKAGAHGYARKDTKTKDLVAILRAVACGSFVLGPEVSTAFLGNVRRARVRLPEPFDKLTEREREMLGALVRNESVEEIARHLGLSGKTIRNLLSNDLYRKLGVENKFQAVRLVRDRGVEKAL
ncbi:response regulator transcription factor [Phytohabitans houttuyneae]|uniref:DNA-binding response regulator n=1 Tax=Phytohabitans houttuyneae TaxID=1076126 RepID=A0A6V8KLA4_9ACTN|nr:response regulator transcription factor [Phytohabitans houttuyneae]GFJ85982.1 DNA-binding response regulator [Phytohabitans houttuyneae]